MNLRTAIIRLAHQRADLRQHLLPLLEKTAYLAIAPDGDDFEFRGDRAEEASASLAVLVEDSMKDATQHAYRTWRKLSPEKLTSVDVEALRKTYLGLYEEVMDFFDALPHHPRIRRASLLQNITQWFAGGSSKPSISMSRAIHDSEENARKAWHKIAAEVAEYANLTTDPATVRVACSAGLSFTYLNLADEVVGYFSR